MPIDPSCVITMVTILSQLAQDCYAGYENVLYDEMGRCATKFLQDRYDYVKNFKDLWPAVRVGRLIDEVVTVMVPVLKLRHRVRVCYLTRDIQDAGMTSRNHPDMICINPFGVINPMDVVSTTIHELAHLKMFELNHFCNDDHCVVWRECARMFTRAFAVSFQFIRHIHLWSCMLSSSKILPIQRCAFAFYVCTIYDAVD